MMNAKERMHRSIEHVIDDVLKMQDLVIKLSREIHELHVMHEHTKNLAQMKEQIGELHTRLEGVQEFLILCENRAVHPSETKTEIDVIL